MKKLLLLFVVAIGLTASCTTEEIPSENQNEKFYQYIDKDSIIPPGCKNGGC